MSGAVCCVRWWGPSGPMISNDDVAEMCTAHPDRFVGVASVDLMRPMAAVSELRRCVEVHGFRALRILPWLWGLPPDDRRYYPLYAACCELDITFCTQVGHAGPMRASEPGRPIPYLDHVALEFPDLRIVGGHIGVPVARRDDLAGRQVPERVHRHLRIHLRPVPGRASSTTCEATADAKCSSAPNHPFWPAPDCLADLDRLGLDDPTTQAFLHDNAATAFRLT